MSDERLAAAQERLNGIGQRTLEEQAGALEFVQASLVAELADLLERNADPPDGQTADGDGVNSLVAEVRSASNGPGRLRPSNSA